jgi:hypothetical protein
MEGGVSVGDPCEPLAYHGYNGIESATIDAIKKWIKQGGWSRSVGVTTKSTS